MSRLGYCRDVGCLCPRPKPPLPYGIDPDVWEVVSTHAEWVKVPTADAGWVGGKYLRRLTPEGKP